MCNLYLFQVFILDIISQQVSLFARNILPVFVKPGTFEAADTNTSSFCLNAGHMQLKLFQKLDDTVNFDEKKLRR